MPLIPSAVLALAALAAGAASAQVSFLVPPSAAIAGRSQASWSQVWWQWAWSFDADDSPLRDETGELCASRQSGEVWFLGGTDSSTRTIRECTVPQGKYLFFPLINDVVYPSSEGEINCLGAMREVKSLTDAPAALVLELDGVRSGPLESHRQATIGCFDLGELSDPKVRISPAAGNGYYVMLKPLPPGTHTLNFGGVLPKMIQAVTYTLIVR